MTDDVLDAPERIEQDVESELPALINSAKALTVTTVTEAQDAAGLLGAITERRKAIELWFKPLVDAAFRAHRELTQRRAAVLARYAEPERIVRRALSDYQAAENARRAAAEAAARAEATRIADDLRLARAERAMERGDEEQAERILSGEAPEPVVAMPSVLEPERIDGVAFTATWKAEVIDLAALIKAAAASPHLVPLLEPNTKALAQMARALGGALNIPGVRVWQETGVRTR